ncbi:MAG: bacteriohemerythrin [Alphaproteobacteria bacterium]
MLIWSDSYMIGVDEIDRDHQKLFDIVKKVEIAAQADECSKLVDAFLEASRTHFASEESLLSKEEYPDVETHRLYHRDMLDKAKALKMTCAEEVESGKIINCYIDMVSLLLDDVVKGGSQIKSYLQFRKNR